MKRVSTHRYKALLRELREARKNASLTQAEMATRFDTLQGTISKFERGEIRLDVLGFADWCEIAKVDPAEILRRVRQ